MRAAFDVVDVLVVLRSVHHLQHGALAVADRVLAKNMALAADPTVAYAALLSGTYRGAIYQSDLQSDSRYNTYKFAGLKG